MRNESPTRNQRETYQEPFLKRADAVGSKYFTNISELSNLQRLWFKINKAKSTKMRFVEFNKNLFNNLSIIQYRLRNNSFEFGPYQFFKVKEKKMRSIANAPLKDRVVHWLLYEHLQKYWSKRFICDTYGNIAGRGTHAAVKRLSSWARKPSLKYALQMDISKYFFSVQHAYLKETVISKEGDSNIRNVIINLIDSYQTSGEHDHLFEPDSAYMQTTNKGMPLGNLTSQFFSNIYLNGFDHYVKEKLQIKHYIRYVDDMIILSDDMDQLRFYERELSARLKDIGLVVNPKKTQIRQIANGIPFLGFVVWPGHVSAGKIVRRNYSKMLYRSGGKQCGKTYAAYNGIFSHTGPTR